MTDWGRLTVRSLIPGRRMTGEVHTEFHGEPDVIIEWAGAKQKATDIP